jgi:peptidoglycan/LPS O-acetylase OafA/YrhL
MPIGNETSTRIEILRFPLIVGVVFGHDYPRSMSMAQGQIGVAHNGAWVGFIRIFISQTIAWVTVPLFFLISGYLIFGGGWSWKKYLDKVDRRVNTLLVPLLFWTSFMLLAYASAQSIPALSGYFSYGAWPPIRSFTLLDFLNAFFGISVPYPFLYQFWFIRDLMALVVLSPAIHFLVVRRTALPFLLLMFLLWFCTTWPAFPTSVEATFFFALGSYLSLQRIDVNYFESFGRWTTIATSVAFVAFAIVNAVLQDNNPYIQKLMIVFGIPSVWWGSGLAAKNCKLRSSLIELGGASFFVFAAHEPLMKITRKVLYSVFLPTSDFAVLALYFLLPICLIGFLVATHRYLEKTTPSFLGFITGDAYRPTKPLPSGVAGSQSA